MIKKLISLALLMTVVLTAKAQIPVEGSLYYLPKTELRFKLLIEKSTFTPGEFANYSSRFLRKDASNVSSTDYKIIGVSMYQTAIPDTTKLFFVPIDKKHTIFSVEKSENGILTAINEKGVTPTVPEEFVPAKQAAVHNPHDFMSAEILSAGSTSKMAELTAREIYDIRDSRNQLSRGEADFMPKDGEQLRIMLESLNRQEEILTQAFQGVVVKDTLEKEVVFCPEKDQTDKQMLFRFSKKLGLVDNDDMAGSPYYIYIEDLKIVDEIQTQAEGEKRSKNDMGIIVNMPGKIRVTVSEGNKAINNFEVYAAQFGNLESISSNLFGKKFTTHLRLNPVTGIVEHMEVEPLE